jgi:hypothetical protein
MEGLMKTRKYLKKITMKSLINTKTSLERVMTKSPQIKMKIYTEERMVKVRQNANKEEILYVESDMEIVKNP